MNQLMIGRLRNVSLLLIAAWVLFMAGVQLYNIAWGTGVWLGQFAPSWALVFTLFIAFCILLLIGMETVLRAPQNLGWMFDRLIWLRENLGIFRWVLALLLVLLPVYVLQYTFWGIVLHERYLRILLAGLCAVLVGWLITKKGEGILSWPAALTGFLLVSAACTFFAPLRQVTSYPFSLGWSEGNRLWDYSVLFGRHLYDYPADKSIPVYLDIGRQFVGGIPYLIPGLTIWQERLWLALIDVIPYLVLGWVAYRLPGKNVLAWVLAGIWAFIFVKQGPIHPPLLLCAIIVAIAWGRPLWLAIPLILGASYFAVASRFTWLFAPGMWAAMLELSSGLAQSEQLDKRTWQRAISVGLAGILGGYVAPFFVPQAVQWVKTIGGQDVAGAGSGGVTLDFVSTSLSTQSLLWYRLFPNATYGPGILLALILACMPLIVVLLHLAKTRSWILNHWQKLAIVLPLFAFLVVGLIVSTKIGGGGDLHNMDMFIIGLMFAGAMAWRNGGYQWITSPTAMPVWIRFAILAMIVLPGYIPLVSTRPMSIKADIEVVATLADIVLVNPAADSLPSTLPSEAEVMEDLSWIQSKVAEAAPHGDILFIDQRQLLTFGYIQGIPLFPEYDKKVLIDQALSENASYFETFYRDLAAQRFSLIISNPLHQRIKTESADFGEENNAWVKWVSSPILCYYEPLYTLKKVDIQLLTPRQDISQCAQLFP
jgi:hypothetical protein